MIKNCLKDINSENIIKDNDKNKIKNNGLNFETIEKIVDLFKNFEAALYLSKGQRSNNPTSLKSFERLTQL
jgi:hypothetical protein